MKEVKSFLRKKKAKLSELWYWAIHPDYKNKKLEDFLISRDFKFNLEIGMVLGQRVSLRIDPDVLIEGGSEMTEEWEQVQKTEYQNDIFVKTPQIPELLKRKRERFKDPRVEIYVAKLRGKPVGKMTLFTSGKTAQIDEVYTLPDFRIKRVSSTLMATLIDIARLRDVKNIIVVAPDTFKSMEMYKRIGFVKKIELPGYCL
jgi:GNAT superfamily N-acetyltransferase